MTGKTMAWTRIMGCLAFLASAVAAQGLLLGGTDGSGFEDEHGTSIVRMEDIDGDDVADFAVGSPGGSFGGHVHIYSGRTFLPLGGFGAEDTSSRVGTSLAAGTTGLSSVLVAGDPEMQVTLVPFPVVVTTGGIHKVRVAHRSTATGNSAFTGFGNVLAEVGDITGDGISDFAVGQPDASSGSPLFGRVELRNGRTGLLIRFHVNILPTASSKFGAAVAGLPDLDGDGVNDYAIGDPLADANGLDSGEVRGFSGASGALLFTLTGAVGDRFGSAVVGLKNVQVGGSEEPGFAVGAPFNDPSGVVDAGSVFVFAGFPPAAAFTLDGDTLAGSGGKFGSSLAAGQLSLASLSRNLLVGAPGAAQTGHAEAGRAFCFDMSNGALTNQFFNPTPVAGEHFGAAVACGSDRVGNGSSTHFIIGAPDASSGRGAVYVYNDFSGLEATFDADACFWCLGVTSAGLSEAEYMRITHDFTLAAARVLVRPKMTFVFVSGTGAERDVMWARVKRKTEEDVQALPFKDVYVFRPGMIQPLHGIKSRTRMYNVLYPILWPLIVVTKLLKPSIVTDTDRVGRALLRVVKRGYPKKVLENPDINEAASG